METAGPGLDLYHAGESVPRRHPVMVETVMVATFELKSAYGQVRAYPVGTVAGAIAATVRVFDPDSSQIAWATVPTG